MPGEFDNRPAARSSLIAAFIILSGMILWLLAMCILGPNYRPVP